MNESNQERKQSANQEIERLHFLVHCRLCWNQLGVKLLLEVWWVLVILIFVIAIISILLRLKRWKDWS